MQELEPTWGRVLSVWWLLAWRSMVGALLIGAVLGTAFAAFAALRNWPAESIQASGTAITALIGLIWVIVVVRMALKKQYGNFRIALLPMTAA